jgi:hypothetical protein
MSSFNHSTGVKIKRHLAELSVLLTNHRSINDVDEGSKHNSNTITNDVMYNTEVIDDSQIDKLYRLLRPMKATFNHSNAIKLRLRQLILNQSIQINQNSNNNGELIINQFEKIYDKLLKRNPTLLNHFLVIFYPFSFRTQILSSSSSSSSSSSYINLIKRDNNNDNNNNNSTIHQIKPNQSKINRFVESSTKNSYKDNESSTTTDIVRKETKIHISSELMDNESKYVWLARELELKLLTDLIYILQVQ